MRRLLGGRKRHDPYANQGTLNAHNQAIEATETIEAAKTTFSETKNLANALALLNAFDARALPESVRAKITLKFNTLLLEAKLLKAEQTQQSLNQQLAQATQQHNARLAQALATHQQNEGTQRQAYIAELARIAGATEQVTHTTNARFQQLIEGLRTLEAQNTQKERIIQTLRAQLEDNHQEVTAIRASMQRMQEEKNREAALNAREQALQTRLQAVEAREQALAAKEALMALPASEMTERTQLALTEKEALDALQKTFFEGTLTLLEGEEEKARQSLKNQEMGDRLASLDVPMLEAETRSAIMQEYKKSLLEKTILLKEEAGKKRIREHAAFLEALKKTQRSEHQEIHRREKTANRALKAAHHEQRQAFFKQESVAREAILAEFNQDKLKRLPFERGVLEQCRLEALTTEFKNIFEQYHLYLKTFAPTQKDFESCRLVTAALEICLAKLNPEHPNLAQLEYIFDRACLLKQTFFEKHPEEFPPLKEIVMAIIALKKPLKALALDKIAPASDGVDEKALDYTLSCILQMYNAVILKIITFPYESDETDPSISAARVSLLEKIKGVLDTCSDVFDTLFSICAKLPNQKHSVAQLKTQRSIGLFLNALETAGNAWFAYTEADPDLIPELKTLWETFTELRARLASPTGELLLFPTAAAAAAYATADLTRNKAARMQP